MALPALRDLVPNLHHNEPEFDALLQVMEGERTEETLGEWKLKVLIPVLHQMMFVAGETAEPSVETTNMVEEIVRRQVVHVLQKSTELSHPAGKIGADQMFFLYRNQKAKLARLKNFLAWKEVRKTAKASDDKVNEATDLGAGVDPLVGGEDVAGSSGLAAVDTAKKVKRVKVTLPWDDERRYGDLVPELKEGDEDEPQEMDSPTAKRLDLADRLTQGMTQKEYLHFSECRQASFTFRKGKKFREWAGIGVVADGKPNDDFIDMLGFVISEAVETLTKKALVVKRVDDALKSRNAKIAAAAATNGVKRKHEVGLFASPAKDRTAIGPKHVQEAFRLLQEKPYPGYLRKPNLGGPMGLRRQGELRLF